MRCRCHRPRHTRGAKATTTTPLFRQRQALGARHDQIVGSVIHEGLRLTLWGLAVGMLLVVPLASFLETQLFGISPLDFWAIGGGSGLLLIATFVASWVPARQATQTTPMTVLGHAPHRCATSDSILPLMLDIDAILDSAPTSPDDRRLLIGTSLKGRPIFAWSIGHGPLRISLIAGNHADEPVGPAMLEHLVAYLLQLPQNHSLLETFSFAIVPHTNPDGEARNRSWIDPLGDRSTWSRRSPQVEVDLTTYLAHVVREAPGDDLEFGFPRSTSDHEARPEAVAVAGFLGAPELPFALHASFHGMAFAAGPWFLIERSWADPNNDRTAAMRSALLDLVAERSYTIHDIDRGGSKGFHRISRGFTSRPDSQAMRAHFQALGQNDIAELFRPSSMEWVRGLGGDPLTLVSEMPLFLLPPEAYENDVVFPQATRRLNAAASQGSEALARVARDEGVRPMPLRDQMYFQLAFLDQALATIKNR